MFTLTKYNFIVKAILLTFTSAFLAFGSQHSVHNPLNKKYLHQHTASCCKNCGYEDCCCCAKHKEQNSDKSDDCGCQVSKDMDDKPLSLPASIKFTDFYHPQPTLIFQSDFKLNNFTILIFSIEHSNSVKEDTSTVLRI